MAQILAIWFFPALFLLIFCFKRHRQWIKREIPLPPGPTPLPFIDNLLDYPHESPWLVYDKWCKQYGKIVSISVLGQRIIILGSADAIADLMDKRSANYSDRVRFPMMNEILCWNWNFAFMKYGVRWRQRRQVFTQHFSPTALRKFYHVHTKHSLLLLQRLLRDRPRQIEPHLRQTSAGSIMETMYAVNIKDRHDPCIKMAEEALLSLSIAGVFGTFWADHFPILKYVPSWFPGARFKKVAEKWNKSVRGLREYGFEMVMARNEDKPCVTKAMLDGIPNSDNAESVEIVKDAVGIAFGAGADTTVSANLTFFLAMASYPEAQRRAQAEIDAVIGRDRLPDFNDRANLPYINALIKEVIRWQSVTPLAVFHCATEDDVYDGYFIPKGSLIVGNAWAATHDPDVYPEPDKFLPDRFLKDGKPDPKVRNPFSFAFGFGRRICPGRFFGLDGLYSIISNVLACYNIEAPVVKDGKEVQLPPHKMSTGVVSFPNAFEVVIKPRYKGVETLIDNAVLNVREI